MGGIWYILLDVFVQMTLFASAQGQGDISVSIADAVAEVDNRRHGGPAFRSGE